MVVNAAYLQVVRGRLIFGLAQHRRDVTGITAICRTFDVSQHFKMHAKKIPRSTDYDYFGVLNMRVLK